MKSIRGALAVDLLKTPPLPHNKITGGKLSSARYVKVSDGTVSGITTVIGPQRIYGQNEELSFDPFWGRQNGRGSVGYIWFDPRTATPVRTQDGNIAFMGPDQGLMHELLHVWQGLTGIDPALIQNSKGDWEEPTLKYVEVAYDSGAEVGYRYMAEEHTIPVAEAITHGSRNALSRVQQLYPGTRTNSQGVMSTMFEDNGVKAADDDIEKVMADMSLPPAERDARVAEIEAIRDARIRGIGFSEVSITSEMPKVLNDPQFRKDINGLPSEPSVEKANKVSTAARAALLRLVPSTPSGAAYATLFSAVGIANAAVACTEMEHKRATPEECVIAAVKIIPVAGVGNIAGIVDGVRRDDAADIAANSVALFGTVLAVLNVPVVGEGVMVGMLLYSIVKSTIVMWNNLTPQAKEYMQTCFNNGSNPGAVMVVPGLSEATLGPMCFALGVSPDLRDKIERWVKDPASFGRETKLFFTGQATLRPDGHTLCLGNAGWISRDGHYNAGPVDPGTGCPTQTSPDQATARPEPSKGTMVDLSQTESVLAQQGLIKGIDSQIGTVTRESLPLCLAVIDNHSSRPTCRRD